MHHKPIFDDGGCGYDCDKASLELLLLFLKDNKKCIFV